MACIQPYWSCLQLGSQHLARQFAAHGFDVHYFSSPVTPLHLPRIKNSEVRKRYLNSSHNPWTDPQHRIKSYIPFSLIAPDGLPVLRDHLVTRYWHKTMLPGWKKFLKKNGLDRVKILYIDNLSYHFLLDHVEYDKCVFRVMDMHEHFPGWKGKTEYMAKKIAEQADLTIYSALGLRTYVDSLNPGSSLLVPNGVDFDFFQSPKNPGVCQPALSHIPDPLILYVGMIDSWLDMRLISRTAQKNPDVSFVFVGPVSTKMNKDNPHNLFFTGPVDHNELPHIMSRAKACLIPFDVDKNPDLIKGIRPLKLLEYMAAGLPVISSRWPEIEDMNSPAWLYDSDDEFEKLVQRAISCEQDPEPFKAFSRQNDWKNSFNLLMKELRSC